MFKGLTTFFEWIQSGADRELQRVRESRKYFASWVLTALIMSVYAYLYIKSPSWDEGSTVMIDGVESLLILWGMYFGANTISKSRSVNEQKTYQYIKLTNNEDESDPETMPL